MGNKLNLDNRVTKQYIEILELMFIVRRIPAWLRNRGKRQAARMPKLHFVDTGLACHVLGLRNSRALLESQYYGDLLESLVAMELSKHAEWAHEHAIHS